MHDDLFKEAKSALSDMAPIDEAILRGFLKAAVSYSEKYQQLPLGTYTYKPMGSGTRNAVIHLTCHYYIMKDGKADLSQGKEGVDIMSEINEQLWVDMHSKT